MLKSSTHVIRRFDWQTVRRGPVPQKWLKAARQVKVLTEAEVSQKKAKGGKAAVRASRKSHEQELIEMVVARASASAGVDVMHDYRRPFPRTAMHAVRVG